MTKIQITPKWSDVKPSGCYVYLHIRKSNGVPFYVGMGKDKRGWVKRTGGAAKWWKGVASKHGVRIEVVQDSLDRASACILEMWLIAKFRYEGINIVNITSGGDGVSGLSIKKTKDQRLNIRDINGGRPVFCSNGMEYESASHAAREISIHLGRKCNAGNIYSVCIGARKSYLGMSFSYECVPAPPPVSGAEARAFYARKNHSKKVYSSLGEVYSSNTEAASEMRKKGYEKASDVPISSCASGVIKSAYGRSWSYDGFPPHPLFTGREASSFYKSKAVVNSDGEIFISATSAALAMRDRGYPKAGQGNISTCARGGRSVAYGYKWYYVEGG